MQLKKITLDNIRSYVHEEVEFSKGSTLLSGDIGCGKTSILLGIEFALFGLQPGQRGMSLLRNGTTEGGVKMEFEVGGKEVLIERTLKKTKTVAQDVCSITIDGIKSDISVTELKSKILDLLNYPKEFSKKQNLLYKFTVYTPQEEMKQIILQDADTRINTLRHVFGIDKYKKILENISIVNSKIREEKRMKEGMTHNLGQDKTNLLVKEIDLETKKSNLLSVEKDFFLAKEERKKRQGEKEEIEEKIKIKIQTEREIEKTKLVISTKRDAIMNNSRIVPRLREELEKVRQQEFDESKIKELENQIGMKKSQKPDLDETQIKITSQINSLVLQNQESETLKGNIQRIDMCPTCLQNVGPVYKGNIVNKFESSISENAKKIEALSIEKRIFSEKKMDLDMEIFQLEKKIADLKLLRIKLQGAEEKEARIFEIEKSNALLERDIKILEENLAVLKQSLFELSRFDALFEAKQSSLKEALNQEKFAEIRVAELKREIEVFSKQIEELKESIQKIEEIKSKLNYITGLENWLSTKFIPAISMVEKNVMVTLKGEFSRVFSEWFNMLVSESFNVRLRDDFTPIIEQQDYELDYSYLSGGERTAVALAYRLALNQVINSLLSKIKTKDFVILDEPTDGFSEQQLDKMREVLDQLEVNQLIIVSHEQKIEGFVENVIRFKKENQTSKRI